MNILRVRSSSVASIIPKGICNGIVSHGVFFKCHMSRQFLPFCPSKTIVPYTHCEISKQAQNLSLINNTFWYKDDVWIRKPSSKQAKINNKIYNLNIFWRRTSRYLFTLKNMKWNKQSILIESGCKDHKDEKLWK